MRRLALLALTAAALAGCNKTDRDNIRNAAGNAAAETGNGLSKAASATENFAVRTGSAISNGVRETDRSLRGDESGKPTTDSSGKPSTSDAGGKPPAK